MTTYDYLKENEEKVKELSRLGFIKQSTETSMRVYEEYVSTEDMEETDLVRFEIVAHRTKYKPDSVRKIVQEMKKPVTIK